MGQNIDHEWTDVPVCPHCGCRDEDWWDGIGLQNDGDKVVRDCAACDEQYVAAMSVEVRFDTKKLGVE